MQLVLLLPGLLLEAKLAVAFGDLDSTQILYYYPRLLAWTSLL